MSLKVILVMENKILTIDNLAKLNYNIISMTTCVLCQAETETVDHLFFNYPFTSRIWGIIMYYFIFLTLYLPIKEVRSSWVINNILGPKCSKNLIICVIY